MSRQARPFALALIVLAATGPLISASFKGTPNEATASELELAPAPIQNNFIPVGYILPAQLAHTLSIRDARAGEKIEARIMQEVPLPNRGKIAFRSIVKGIVLNVARDEVDGGAELTMRFDTVNHRGQSFQVATSLRAIASFFAVHNAQLPASVYDEAAPLSWANTIQIGGDIRFGDGDSVRNRWKETVGRAVPGGVLVYARANPERGCEGPASEELPPQALWLFSSDACGVYGLRGIQLVRSGRSEPVGEITLHFKKANMKLNAGTGLLLRIVAAAPEN